MLLTALGLFAVAALGGVIMAVRVFGGKMPPWGLSILHLAFGGAGLVTLFLALNAAPGDTLLMWALGLFVVAALGGLVLAYGFHLRNRAHPKGLVGLHALLAVSAFVILALRAFGMA